MNNLSASLEDYLEVAPNEEYVAETKGLNAALENVQEEKEAG